MASHAVLTDRTAPSGPDRKLILGVSAEVRPTLRVEPETLTFDLAADPAGPIVKTVAIDSARLDRFALSDAGTSAPWVVAEVEEPESRRGGPPARLKVTLDPAALPADYWDSPAPATRARVRTTSGAEPELSIPVLIRKPKEGEAR